MVKAGSSDLGATLSVLALGTVAVDHSMDFRGYLDFSKDTLVS
jgi:hypothetical protein